MSKEEKSPAMQLLEIVWGNACTNSSFSWERLNHAMHDALTLAVASGLPFNLCDFREISNTFRFGYWGGADSAGFAERFYRIAVARRNIKACQSFEEWKGRKPYIFDNVRVNVWHLSRGDHRFKSSRLCAAAEFEWNGEQVSVTSFHKDEYLVACSYHPKKNYNDRAKVKHRYKISHAELKAVRRAAREAAKAEAEKAKADQEKAA